MTNNLVVAKKERAIIRDSINRFINKLETICKDANPDVVDLEETLELLIETTAELKIKDSEIKTLTQEAQLEAELETANEYREKILTWRFRANRKLRELKKSETNVSIENETRPNFKEAMHIKLPKLNLAKFTGNTADFLTFWSSFETAIHNNKSLDPVDKFNYLKSFLAPEPLKCIEGFSVTASNYEKVIDILKQRYGREDLLVNVHLNKLLNITPLKHSSDIKMLRKIYDDIQINIRSLESLNVSLDSYGSLLSPILLKILPEDLALQFNMEFYGVDYGVKDILSFLSKQLVSRESLMISRQDDCGDSHFSPRAQRLDNQNRRDVFFLPR